MYIPQFIVIEGLDGAGKSTQIEMLRDAFQARNQACRLTAEPTDLPTGLLIRSVLQGDIQMDPRALAALYAADRIEHLYHADTGILESLAAGYHVIASRYYFSSLAYQSEYASPQWIAALNRHARQTLPADFTFFLDLEPEESMRRIKERGDSIELFETQEKLTHVRESFHKAFKYYGENENIFIINASQAPQEIFEEIWSIVNDENEEE